MVSKEPIKVSQRTFKKWFFKELFKDMFFREPWFERFFVEPEMVLL